MDKNETLYLDDRDVGSDDEFHDTKKNYFISPYLFKLLFNSAKQADMPFTRFVKSLVKLYMLIPEKDLVIRLVEKNEMTFKKLTKLMTFFDDFTQKQEEKESEDIDENYLDKEESLEDLSKIKPKKWTM